MSMADSPMGHCVQHNSGQAMGLSNEIKRQPAPLSNALHPTPYACAYVRPGFRIQTPAHRAADGDRLSCRDKQLFFNALEKLDLGWAGLGSARLTLQKRMKRSWRLSHWIPSPALPCPASQTGSISLFPKTVTCAPHTSH
ncbi:hypothetical protein JZ751_012776 [Albula glossodonta]|uniref:Uncharacterized protein n=1 Tax=Albula glossodonta TaxID=121402 RepID=A0A8T2MK67_9TELE|nr:hypothetical protein JZ751_012776 [Albula glossodonta]